MLLGAGVVWRRSSEANGDRADVLLAAGADDAHQRLLGPRRGGWCGWRRSACG
jgi:hypothetical protein